MMAAAKFNAFHWHIVDDESFPMECELFPELAQYGGFKKGQTDSRQDMLDAVEYAATLAIRVIPEFDNPGHTRAVGFAPEFKEIVRCFNKDWAFTVPNAYKIKGGSPTGVLDPSYSKTFDLIRGLFVEFGEIFPDTFLHLGGDEVLTSCYNENPNIKSFMN